LRFWGSLFAVACLATVHLTVGRWSILKGPQRQFWLSISAGTALAYVFTYLLPKLAVVQSTLGAGSSTPLPFLRHHTYLLALAGLLAFFALASSVNVQADSPLRQQRSTLRELLLIVGYGAYSVQLGLLIADLPEPGILSYLLVTLILGLHLMGIDQQLNEAEPIAYERKLRYAFIIALFTGWTIGSFTESLRPAVVFSSTFVAGGIMINAIREEMPTGSGPIHASFLIAVVVATAAILGVQVLQSGT